MVFNFDEEMVMNVINEALEDAAFNASQEQMNKIVNAIDESFPGVIAVLANGMEEHWKSEAKGVMTGWGEKYAAAIKSKIEGSKAEIYVDEEMKDKGSGKPSIMFVDMVEKGMKSFSIKDALLASEKAKIGPDGVKYITVPFPVATPRKEGQGKQASKFGGREMTQEMHRIVKSGGKIKSGKLKTGQNVAGLTRYNTRQRHSQYGIFRRVSEKSQGWIHPGVGPEPVYKKVLSEVNKRVAEVLTEYCKAIVKEYTQ
jgi:hypothetical protein